jgi:hypothetical protein
MVCSGVERSDIRRVCPGEGRVDEIGGRAKGVLNCTERGFKNRVLVTKLLKNNFMGFETLILHFEERHKLGQWTGFEMLIKRWASSEKVTAIGGRCARMNDIGTAVDMRLKVSDGDLALTSRTRGPTNLAFERVMALQIPLHNQLLAILTLDSVVKTAFTVSILPSHCQEAIFGRTVHLRESAIPEHMILDTASRHFLETAFFTLRTFDEKIVQDTVQDLWYCGS